MGEVFLEGENVTITEDAQIGRDGFTAVMDMRIEGKIPRQKGNKKMDKFTEY